MSPPSQRLIHGASGFISDFDTLNYSKKEWSNSGRSSGGSTKG